MAGNEDPEAVDAELEKRFSPEKSLARPLYVTYSIPEDERLPSFVL